MTAKELLMPRFEVVNTYPQSDHRVGDVITLDLEKEDGRAFVTLGKISCFAPYFQAYPHIFRQLKWWEGRKEHEMPKRLVSPIFPDDVIEVVKWDMGELFGYSDVKKRQGCMLEAFKPEYEYQPID